MLPLPRFFFCCACIINRLCLTKSGHSCEVCAPQLVNMPLPTSLDTFLRSMDMLRSSIYVAKAPEPRLPPRQGQFFRMPLASPPNLGQSLVHCCEVRSACFCHVRAAVSHQARAVFSRSWFQLVGDAASAYTLSQHLKVISWFCRESRWHPSSPVPCSGQVRVHQ